MLILFYCLKVIYLFNIKLGKSFKAHSIWSQNKIKQFLSANIQKWSTIASLTLAFSFCLQFVWYFKNIKIDNKRIFQNYICLKKSCFPDCWKVSLILPVFKIIGERSTAENYCPVSFLFVLSKVFEKLVNDWIVDYLEKYSLFCYFHYGFRSSQSTAYLLSVVFNIIASVFNSS